MVFSRTIDFFIRSLSKALVVLCILSSMSGAQESKDDEYQTIFNGADLAGWEGLDSLWSVEDGAITGTTVEDAPIRENTFLVWKDRKIRDFVLELDYKIRGGNSGIQYRSTLIHPDRFVVGGYQADIDSGTRYTGINYEERGRGILAERGQRVRIDASGAKSTEPIGDADELSKLIKDGDWNHYRVEAIGNRLQHWINDNLMSEVVDDQVDKAASEGILAFQLHAGPPMKVQFKNIRIRLIDEQE